MSWYAQSYSWIKKQQIENKDMSKAELRKHCSKNYPYSQRSGYAYKAFLQAMRDVFGAARTQPNKRQADMLANDA